MPRLLTKKQIEVLAAIERWIRLHHYAPTVRELRDALGMNQESAVHNHLKALKKKRCIDWVEGKSRTIHILKDTGAHRLDAGHRPKEG